MPTATSMRDAPVIDMTIVPLYAARPCRPAQFLTAVQMQSAFQVIDYRKERVQRGRPGDWVVEGFGHTTENPNRFIVAREHFDTLYELGPGEVL